MKSKAKSKKTKVGPNNTDIITSSMKERQELTNFFQHQSTALLSCQLSLESLSVCQKQIYDALIAQPGISRDEIIKEITSNDYDESTTTSDDILFAIISKRQQQDTGPCSTWAKIELMKQKENEVLDQVLLLSEGERENISSRKRKRKEDLQTDCSINIFDAEEFSYSTLIHSGNGDGDGDDNKCKAILSDIVKELDKSNVECFNRQLQVFQNTHNNEKVEDNVNSKQHIDDSSKSNTSLSSSSSTTSVLHSSVPNISSSSVIPTASTSSSYCVCSDTKKLIRKVVVTLLYLEKDSFKFHGKHCVKYFQLLNRRMESQFSEILYVVPSSNQNDGTATGGGSQCNSENSSIHVSSLFGSPSSAEHDRVIEFLKTELEVLEENLYLKVTDDGNCIPRIFRECDSDCHFDDVYDISNDGFEIIKPPISSFENKSTGCGNDADADDADY